MDFFEFILIITSVIYALCMAPLLTGFVRLLQSDDEVKYFLPHAAFSLYLFLAIPVLWWTSWSFRDVDWDFATYLYMVMEPAVMFVACSLVIPQRLDDRTRNLESYYYKIRVPLLTSVLLLSVLIYFDGVAFGIEGLWHGRRPVQLFELAILVWALVDKRKPAQYVAAVGSVLIMLAIVANWFWMPAN